MSKSLDILCDNLTKLLGGRSNYWLSQESGMNQGTLSRIRAKTLNPSLETVEAMADALKVTAAELITKDAKPSIPADIIESLEGQSNTVYDAIRMMMKAFVKEKAPIVSKEKAAAASKKAAPKKKAGRLK